MDYILSKWAVYHRCPKDYCRGPYLKTIKSAVHSDEFILESQLANPDL